jgi:hypothetical protein
MGWWGVNLFDGDEPLDALGNIADKCKLKYDDDGDINDPALFHSYPFTKQIIEENLDKIVPESEHVYECHLIVVGALILFTGAKLPNNLKNKIIKCAKNDKGWNWDEEKDRKECMEKFIEKIKSYKEGTRWKANNQGDFLSIDPSSKRFMIEPS